MFLKKMAYYFLMGIFCFHIQVINSQDQRISDSLAVIYMLDTLNGNAKLELLRSLSFNEINNFDLALDYQSKMAIMNTFHMVISKREMQNNLLVI